VSKYLTNAKTAEAKNALGQMSKDATTAFAREGMSAAVMALGSSTGTSHALCTSAGNAVPSAITSVLGRKYQSSPSEWSTGNQFAGWTCLKFTMDAPQYYMYSYGQSGAVGAENGAFTSIANGDLDGDTTSSTFSLAGKIQKDGNELVLVTAPNTAETNPDE
jgi:type IV pilus assembly protein PilA